MMTRRAWGLFGIWLLIIACYALAFPFIAHGAVARDTSTTNSGSSGTASCTITASGTGARIVLLWVAYASTTAMGSSDVSGGGLTWARLRTSSDGSSRTLELWWAYSSSLPSGTVSATLPASVDWRTICTTVSGCASTVNASNITTATSSTASTTVTSTVKQCLFFGASCGPPGYSTTAGSGYTADADVTVTTLFMHSEYLTTAQSSAGGLAVIMNIASGSMTWIIAGCAIAPASIYRHTQRDAIRRGSRLPQ